jgi:hypothetical protein
MNGIISGNITNCIEQCKSILEKHLKLEQFITIKDNIDEKQLTISISAGISNDVDIYNVLRDGVLYMYIFHVVKRGKKTLDSRTHDLASPTTDKDILINYKDAATYNITVACKSAANISKNLKKQKLELIARIDGSRALYKFMNKYLFMIDINGTVFYYPDSISITSLKSWFELSAHKNDLPSFPDSTITLDKYLTQQNFVSLECHLDTSAYGLCDILGCDSSTSNVLITSSTNMQSQNNLEFEICNQIQSDSNNSNASINTGTDASYSALGYILSWLNPLAYYTSNSSNSSSSSSSSSSSNTSSSVSTIAIPNIDIEPRYNSYFLDKSSLNCDLIKIQDSQVKILKAQKIEIPAFITDITIDKVDNIIISGRIDNQPINMKYNKYMIGMHLV